MIHVNVHMLSIVFCILHMCFPILSASRLLVESWQNIWDIVQYDLGSRSPTTSQTYEAW